MLKRMWDHRWFVLGVLFLGINTVGVLRLTGNGSRPGTVRVVSFTGGRDGLVAERDPLTWVFSSGMAPAEAIDRWSAVGPVTIEPPTEGRFCWVSARELRFQPAAAWRDCTAFTAQLENDLSDTEGRRLSGAARFAFATAALSLNEIRQVDFSADRRCTLRLTFNGLPLRSRLASHLAIQDEAGADVGFEVQGQADSRTVLLATAPIQRDRFTLTLRQGLESAQGTRGLASNCVWTCAFKPALALVKIEPEARPFESAALDVHFTTPLDMDRLSDYIEIDPPVELAVTRLSRWNSSGCTLTGAFLPGHAYALTFKAGLAADNGAVLGEAVTRQVHIPDCPPAVAFNTAGHYLSTRGRLQVPVQSVNVARLTVTAERVYPNNLVYFAARQADGDSAAQGWWYGAPQEGLSHVSGREVRSIPLELNRTVESRLNLSTLMGAARAGAFLLTVAPDKGEEKQHLVIVSDIGISVKRSADDLLVWANSIHSLEPVTGALVRAFSAANQELWRGATDADGLAHFRRDRGGDAEAVYLVTVERGDDVSYLALSGAEVALPGDIGGADYVAAGYEAYLFTDRGIYRPGETLHVKAVVRTGALRAPADSFPVSLGIRRPDGRMHRTLTGALNAWGTAEFELAWPTYALTGAYTLELRLPGSDACLGEAHIAVEEFVPPQIVVGIKDGPERVSTNLDFVATAAYLFGRPGAGLPAEASARFQPVDFTHPDWPGYTFSDAERAFAAVDIKIGTGRLDADGAGRFAVAIPRSWRPPSALKAIIGTTVTEVSGRAVSAYTSRLVDVYPYYLGIKPAAAGRDLRAGKPADVMLAAVRPAGTPVPEVLAVPVSVARVSWSRALKRQDDDSYAYESERLLIPVEAGTAILSNGCGRFAFTPSVAGPYLLTAGGADGGVAASLQFYAGGAGDDWQAWSMERPELIEMAADKEGYQPGDTARLVIKAPFAGRALLTIESDRILSNRVFELEGNTAELAIPLGPDWMPNVYCTISILRPVAAGELWGAHRAVGTVALKVSEPARRLKVEWEAPAVIRPGSRLKTHVRVSDEQDAGVPVELSLALVDEGICMLTAFRTPDPLRFFERQRRLGVALFDLYGLLMPELDQGVRDAPSAPGGDAAVGIRGRLNPIDARRFRPLALWRSSVKTDAAGCAEVEWDVPEFTGELRLMAVAVARERFGSAEAAVKVKRPLVVISSLPRFLAPTDRCTVPVTVFNETGAAQAVRVSLRGSGSVSAGAAWQEAPLGPGECGRFAVELAAAALPGKGRVELIVEAGVERYAEEWEVAVRPASPRTSRSDFGSIGPGASVEFALPDDWLEGTGRHAVRCSGLPALKLAGGLDYLLRYPYGCLEQTVSSSFPLLYLADVMAVLRPGTLGSGETAHFVQAGVNRILAMQQSDGSFSYWPGSTATYRWGSLYATHFLLEAERAGYDVPADFLNAALAWMEKLPGTPPGMDGTNRGGAWRSEMNARTYACHVLALAGRPLPGWLARMLEQVEGFDVSARLNLAAACAASGDRAAAARILRSVGAADAMASARETEDGLNSGIRQAAMLLAAWLEVDPQDAVVPMLARSLEGLNVNGGWYTTQDNAMALLALGKYARLLQREGRPFDATVSWQGRDGTVSHTVTAQAEWAVDSEASDMAGTVRITNAGPGVAYYYWRSEGIAVDGAVAELDHQVAVRREWWDLDGNAVDPDRLRQGELIIVGLTLDSEDRTLANLVIEDLLPAGLEVENAALATSRQVPWVRARQTLPVQHVETRDDRVVVFVSRLQGRQSFLYAARAVTPGTFVYPALAAECMYDPAIRSVHGRRNLRVSAMESLDGQF